jgi:hypothetical protein
MAERAALLLNQSISSTCVAHSFAHVLATGVQ